MVRERREGRKIVLEFKIRTEFSVTEDEEERKKEYTMGVSV
jgi:hypothetical protein